MIVFGVYSSYRISAVLFYFNVVTVRVNIRIYAIVCVAGPAHGCLPQSADQDTADAEREADSCQPVTLIITCWVVVVHVGWV